MQIIRRCSDFERSELPFGKGLCIYAQRLQWFGKNDPNRKEITWKMLENLLSDLIFFVIIAIITHLISVKIPFYKKGFIFKKMKGNIMIIPPEIDITKLDPYNKKSTSIPLGDALALSKIFEVLNKYKDKNELQPSNWEDNIKNQNLVFVGGPMYNIGTRYILENIEGKIHYQFKRIVDKDYNTIDIKFKSFIKKKHSGYDIKIDKDLKVDYGTLIVIKNPWNSQKWIVLVAGLSPISTLGAIESLNKISYFKALKLRKKEFQFIIKCNYPELFCETEILETGIL
jgi:hypothetical protein